MRSPITMLRILCVAATLAALQTAPALARNVDLATVPPRDTVQLTIYNSEDITLVRETRHLSLKRGINRIQYSWANTLIDPTSVEIRPLEKASDIEVLDATYPADKPQQLTWNIESVYEGQAAFQVTYFTSGITWSADYVLVSDADESRMSFDGFVQITNNSGEDYDNAEIRLVVGVINLVEKIQDLARRGVIRRDVSVGMEILSRAEKSRAAGLAFEAADAGWGRPAEIIKEGLSEYFIYTIEGRQTVPNGWSKRLASFQARQVMFDVLYRLRPYQYGPRPVRFMVLKNDREHNLGTTPLPDGVVRTFRDNGRDGLSFLGSQQVKYVPIKGEIELNVGTDDEVVSEMKVMSVERSQFAFNRQQQVEGWDEARLVREELRNYRSLPIRVEVRRVIPGDIELSAEGARLHDYRTVEFAFDVDPLEKRAWEYGYTQHLGRNAKQNAIRLR